MEPKEEKPYFAPPAEGAPPEGEAPKWGDDAAAIAREAGLGSYGAEQTEQEAREDVLLASIERMDGELANLRRSVATLWVVVVTLGAITISWLMMVG